MKYGPTIYSHYSRRTCNAPPLAKPEYGGKISPVPFGDLCMLYIDHGTGCAGCHYRSATGQQERRYVQSIVLWFGVTCFQEAS